MTNTPMTSKEAFEQWHKSEYQGHNSYSYKHDTTAYIDDYVEIAFMAWQASQAQQDDDVRKDAERLNWIEKNFCGLSDSERYLPFRLSWGKGNNRTLREAIDKARE